MLNHLIIKKFSYISALFFSFLIFNVTQANADTLIITKQGEGTVIDDSGAGTGIDCGTVCTENYDTGSVVTLRAVPDAGMVFSSWGGDCSGSNYVTLVTMNANKNCTATFQAGTAGNAIRSGFNQNELPQNDDESTEAVLLGFTINFFGTYYDNVYVNNNGNITFGHDLFSYTPQPLSSAGLRVISPFWADVDTRGSGKVTYGTGTVDSQKAFGVTWNEVGYFQSELYGIDKVNTFQVILVDRSDVLAGAFDIELNYDNIEWEAGDDPCPSCLDGQGTTDSFGGLGSPSARVGYSNGTTVNYELPGSAVSGALINGGSNALAEHSFNSTVIGRYRLLSRGDEVFLTEPEILKVQKAGGGTGRVVSNPAGIDCGETCVKIFQRDSAISLVATASSNSEFKGWSGDSACSDGNFTLSTTTNCIATFELKPSFTLTQAESGNVLISPAGVSCGAECTRYNTGTITLTAVPDVEFRFTGWGGDCSGSSNPLTLTISSDMRCSATFTQIITENFTLTTEGEGSGSINTSPTPINTCGTNCSKFERNTTVTLTAVPQRFSLFTGWHGTNCTGTNPSVTLTMDSAKNCSAEFAVETFILALVFEGNGSGTVTSNPAGVNCMNDCTSTLKGGDIVNLIATAPIGSAFSAWGGECANGQVFMDSNKNCTVHFIQTGKPRFITANNVVQENAGVAIISVGRIEGSEGQLSVRYNTADSTATVDEDYRGRSGIVTWAAGDTTNKTFSIPLLADTVTESDEIVALTLSTLNGETIETATLTIVNVFIPPEIQFISPIATVIEYAGVKRLLVTRAANDHGQVSVDYSTVDGSAIAGQDYTATSGTLTWQDGNSDPKIIEIPIAVDTTTEADENLVVALSNLRMDAVFGNPSTISLVIQDSITTNVSRLQFPSANYAVDENSGSATLTVERVGNTSEQVSVRYNTLNGSATAGSDYVHQENTLIWAIGDSQDKTLNIPILTDSEAESEETIIVQLTSPVGGAILGTIDNAIVKILDETGTPSTTLSSGIVKLTETQYSVSESVGTVTISVERIQGSNGEISVNYSTKNLTALAGEDYTESMGTLTWATGELGIKSFTIPILADEVIEEREDFTVTLSNLTGNASLLTSASVATVHIGDGAGGDDTDNPLGVLQFDMNTYAVAENAGSVSIFVTRLGGTQGAISVQYSMEDGTALVDSDYLAERGVLNWLNGESGSKSFTIGILDNGVAEPTEELTVHLSNPTGGATIGSQNSSVVSINDNDGIFVKLSSSAYVADENSGEITVTVLRDGTSSERIAVHYHTVDSLSGDAIAVAGEDYEMTEGTLVWESGDMDNKIFTIPLIQDNTIEGNEFISVKLFSPEGARLAEPSEAEITVVESEGSHCTGGEEINCYFVNTGILHNVHILRQGTVVGGELSGEIRNDGLVENVTLQANTSLIGGTVHGSISSDPDDIATLNNVTIAAGSTLSNIIVGYNCHVSDEVILGKGVLFENNAVIPSVDLALIVGRKETSVFGLQAIELMKDVLVFSVNGGILTAINGLYDLYSQDIEISQDFLTGILSARIGDSLYTALPVYLEQTLRREAMRDALLGNVGLTLRSDDQVTFVTHTGRQVTAQPVIQAPDFFKESLENTFGLKEITLLPNGNLKVPATQLKYYNGRANLFSSKVEGQLLGVSITTEGNVSFVYQEDIYSWQQLIYPASADPDALFSLSNEVTLNDGEAIIRVLEGTTQRIYHGRFDFAVTLGEPPADGRVQILNIADKNGDTHEDYQILYPNGDKQILFKLP